LRRGTNLAPRQYGILTGRRGSAANKMAANKNRRAHNIIEEKGLDIDFKAITFTTFGGFGEGTHELIKEATKDTDWSLNDPWVKPNPKSHAYLTFGFALARRLCRLPSAADTLAIELLNARLCSQHTGFAVFGICSAGSIGIVMRVRSPLGQ